MTAIRETIIQAFFARMQTVPGLALCRRMPDAEPDEFPALDLDDRGQTLIGSEGATHNRFAMTLAIEGRAQGDGGAATHAALNELYAATVAAIMADDRLGGLVDTIEEGDTSIEISALGQQATLAFTTIFDIQFINRSHDPSLA